MKLSIISNSRYWNWNLNDWLVQTHEWEWSLIFFSKRRRKRKEDKNWKDWSFCNSFTFFGEIWTLLNRGTFWVLRIILNWWKKIYRRISLYFFLYKTTSDFEEDEKIIFFLYTNTPHLTPKKKNEKIFISNLGCLSNSTLSPLPSPLE